jgi:hypothetical protein
MDILDLLKQRLTPLYPQMAPKLPDQHGQIVAQQAAAPSPNYGQLIGAGISAASGLMGGGGMGAYKDSGTTPMEPGTMGPIDVSKFPATPGEEPVMPKPQPMAPAASAIPTSTATRPRVVPGQPITGDLGPQAQPVAQPQPQPALTQALTRRQKIEQDISAIEGKDYSAAVYRDPNTGDTSKKEKPGYVLEKPAGKNYDKTHNILDVLRGIGLGALQGGQKGGISGMIGGAVGGGIGAGVDRNRDNQLMDEFKLGGLRNDLASAQESEIGGYKRDKAEADAIEAEQKPERENKKILADIHDKQAKLQQDALKEALGLKYYDPKRPDHRAIAEQAGIDPDSMPAYDDRNLVERQLDDGTKIKISGSDAYKEEEADKRGDIARTQDITKFNANNQLEVQKKNVDNDMKYQDDVRSVITKISEANADLVGGNSEAQTANQRVQAANTAYQEAIQNDDEDSAKAARADFDKAVADFGKAVGKSQGGSTLAAELKKVVLKRPKAITYEPVKPSTIGGKRKVSKAKDPAGLYQN